MVLQVPAERDMPDSAERNSSRLMLPGFIGFVHLPDDGAGADVLAFVFAVEHRPAGDDDGRNVAAGRAHQQGRGGLVATGQQHDAVDGVATDRFFDVHARQVAGQHGGRAQVRFAVGEDREFNRETTGLDDAAFDVFGDGAEMGVARGQFRPGVADADDRLALELVVGDALGSSSSCGT